jgi:hypothetical protein
MWPMLLVGLVMGLLLWDWSLALQIAALAFAAFYVLVYRFVTHFRVPRWMVIRAKPSAASSRWEVLELGKSSGKSENA